MELGITVAVKNMTENKFSLKKLPPTAANNCKKRDALVPSFHYNLAPFPDFELSFIKGTTFSEDILFEIIHRRYKLSFSERKNNGAWRL